MKIRKITLIMLGMMLAGSSAWAEHISSVSLGVSESIPLGNNGILLNQPVGLELRALSASGFEQMPLPAQISATYLSYSPKNLNNSSIQMFGFYFGVSTPRTHNSSFLIPYASAEVGTVYETLSLNSSANSILNSALGFSLRAIPGVEIPLHHKRFSLQIETPITATWFKTSLYVWSTVLSLRYAL